jgi:hypothetical protein
MRFSQASLGDYHDNCLYFLAGVARNCSVPANLTQLESALPPKFLPAKRGPNLGDGWPLSATATVEAQVLLLPNVHG